jgi:hypothetical protein
MEITYSIDYQRAARLKNFVPIFDKPISGKTGDLASIIKQKAPFYNVF